MGVVVMAAVGSLACVDPIDGGGGNGTSTEPVAELVAEGLSSPVHLTAPPGDDRLFVVEQPGRIRVIDGDELLATPFLDITDRVSGSGERGLLSVAFHPGYAANGRFFVDYTDAAGSTRVEEYAVTEDPNVADAASARTLLTVAQPYPNHNGGLIVFGPEGFLWIGMGDGGGNADENAQDPTTLLGAMLRIDVDAGDPYAIPPDNPHADGVGGAPEVWATGLRNPWRYSMDPATGDLYIADVGQNRWEEVNVADAGAPGLNYGWSIMEGSHCYQAPSCDQTGLVIPVHEYSHDEGCSIIGGYVYRGDALPDLRGHYFYGDYCGGWIRSFHYDGTTTTDHRSYDLGELGTVLSFGKDAADELYVLTSSGVYRLAPGR